MNPLINLWYCVKFDFTRNKWLYQDKKSLFHGVALMFHHVTDDDVDINESCKCRIEHFHNILVSYINQKYEFVSVNTALEYIKNKKQSKFVVVTFDDIPDSVYTNAYPILKEYNIPFTVFITTSFIDRDGYITRQHLEELNKETLCTIGAHTITHPMLRYSPDYYKEISDSKKNLEQIIQRKVEFFAYPFGQYSSVSKRIREVAKNAGYSCAFCTIGAPLNESSSKDIFFLPRFSPTPDENALNKYKVTSLRAFALLVVWPFRRLFHKQ